MKRYKLNLTEKQIRTLIMAFREAEDGNSYQEGFSSYKAVVKDLQRVYYAIYKQLEKQGMPK